MSPSQTQTTLYCEYYGELYHKPFTASTETSLSLALNNPPALPLEPHCCRASNVSDCESLTPAHTAQGLSCEYHGELSNTFSVPPTATHADTLSPFLDAPNEKQPNFQSQSTTLAYSLRYHECHRAVDATTNTFSAPPPETHAATLSPFCSPNEKLNLHSRTRHATKPNLFNVKDFGELLARPHTTQTDHFSRVLRSTHNHLNKASPQPTDAQPPLPLHHYHYHNFFTAPPTVTQAAWLPPFLHYAFDETFEQSHLPSQKQSTKPPFCLVLRSTHNFTARRRRSCLCG